jgi:hypothetical protein
MKISKKLECIKIIKNLPFLFLCILITYPILPHALQSISIGLFVVSSIIIYRDDIMPHINTKGLIPFVLICGWFILVILTLFYSSNFDIGLKRVLRGVNLLIFPLVFLYVLPLFTVKKRHFLFDVFIVVHVFLIFFLISKSLEGIDNVGFRGVNNEWVTNISDEGFLKILNIFFSMPFSHSRYFINENQITTFFIHKAYLSIGLVWSVFLMIDRLFYEKIKVFKRILFGVLIPLFVIVIIYFTSIPNIIALCVTLPFFVFYKLETIRGKKIFVIASITSVFMLLQVNIVKEKILTDMRLKKDLSEAKNVLLTVFSDTSLENANVRLFVWKCSYQQIKDNFFLGLGIGDEEDSLLNCYNDINCEYCIKQQLNTHNYFASLLLVGGLATLIMFLIAFVYMFFIAIKSRNYLFMALIVLLVFNLMSENLLVRIHGVLFYVIFSGLCFTDSFNKLTNKVL